jgi:hypothetical protein
MILITRAEISFRDPRIVAAVFCAALLTAAGCATGPSGSSKASVNALLASHRYAEAEAYLEANKDSQYGQNNAVLFYLDKGVVLNHEGKYAESDATFDMAEQRMDQLYTVSITKAGGMMLLNDNTAEYAGEPYERVLLNVFRAMDYVFLNKHDEALVESRKLERFLQQLNDATGAPGLYKDDAFARYLDALLFADEGSMDDARISLQASDAAYSDYVRLYGMPPPRFDFGPREKHHGELVFIHYNGVAPRKVTRTWQIAWNDAALSVRQDSGSDAQARNALNAGFKGNAITVAYPAIVQDPFRIVASEVWVDSRPVATTQLMENVSAIAAKSLDDRIGLIKTRAIARAATKYILAVIAGRAAKAACERTCVSYACYACGMAGAAAQGIAAATETADERCWGTLPAQIRMARVKLPAGKHDVAVLFKDSMGVVVSSQTYAGVEIGDSKRTYLADRTAQ